MSKLNFENSTIEENLEGDKIKYHITPNQDITTEKLIKLLEEIYDYEAKKSESETIFLKLKGLSTDLLAEAIKYSLKREDLVNPSMLLNILNLVKLYNTLDDSFFEDENIYVSSIEDLLDLKLLIRSEIKAFARQLSIYFISLFKSYNKTAYTPLDNHQKMPNIYKAMILSSDLLTLSGIFASSESFSTDDLVYIDDSFLYLSELLTKNMNTINIMEDFFKGFDDGIKC